jgi:hypothetical protein
MVDMICTALDDLIDESAALPSPIIFLAFCFNEFQLSSQRLVSDDQFLRLVESYVNNNLRPNQHLSFFLIGVMLQRIRRLQSPASRLLMKAIDHCLTHTPENIFNFFLCRVLTSPSTIDSMPSLTSFESPLVPPVEIAVNSFQYEFVQRIIRQNSYSADRNLNSLFSDLMTASTSLSLLKSKNNASGLNQTIDYILLDCLLNSVEYPSAPFQKSISDGLIQHLRWDLSGHKLSTSPFAITQDSLKFLSSIFLSVRCLSTSVSLPRLIVF